MPDAFEPRLLVSSIDNGAPECTVDYLVAREAAVDLLEWACLRTAEEYDWPEWALTKGADTPGVPSLGSVAETVTERRNGLSKKQHWFHSSCGDLCHFLWYQLGVRSNWLNRTANGNYRIGGNLSQIIGHPDFQRVDTFDDVTLEQGDVIMIDAQPNRAHVEVVLHHDPEAGRMAVATYGQDGSKVGNDGRCRRYDCRGRMIRGGRHAFGYLRLDDVLERADQADDLAVAMLPAGSGIGVAG